MLLKKIRFEKFENGAVFKYEDLSRYLMSLLISFPITVGYISLITTMALSGVNNIEDVLIIFFILIIYPFLMIATNIFQVSLINPQWLFTSMKKVLMENNKMAIQYGAFPFCLRRRIKKEEIDNLLMVKQKRGRGMGFLHFFFSQTALFSLILILKTKKSIFLADNEPSNGTLAQEGLKLANHLNIPFLDSSK